MILLNNCLLLDNEQQYNKENILYIFFPGLDQQYDVCLDVLPPSIESQFNSEVAGDLLADDIILDDLDEEIEKDRGEHYSTLE